MILVHHAMSTKPLNFSDSFCCGATWLRADFHLHTRADKEFQYSGDSGAFAEAYAGGLAAAGIRVGVITNHNKFDLDEFKALRREARKQGVFLLPGVELSVNDGANGVHTLVIFSERWIEEGNYIAQFLNVAFTGKLPADYERENGRSNDSILETLAKLEKFERDYFVIFAHVEQGSGLWAELDGGRIGDLGRNELFRQRVLGFQKVRTQDKADAKCQVKVKQWLDDWYPAEVEGSDCKAIEQIGKGERRFLKLGDLSFEAVQYALLDHANRVAEKPPVAKHSHVRSISFEGGVLNGREVCFASGLNTLIGIRGSGKSSIIECLRYALDIPFGEKSADREYKQGLVSHTLGSGGKIVVRAVDLHGQDYEIRRILGDPPDVFFGGTRTPGVSIRETVLRRPLYFGQKDLSNTGEGFEHDLVEKLVGEKLDGIRRRIAEQKGRVAEVVRRLVKLSNVAEQQREYLQKKQDAEFRLKVFREHGVEEKLQRQLDFAADARRIREAVERAIAFLDGARGVIDGHEDELANVQRHRSAQNEAFFAEFFAIFAAFPAMLAGLKEAVRGGQAKLNELQAKAQEFDAVMKGNQEEFAAIERRLAEELKQKGQASIRPDEFLQLQKALEQATQMLAALTKQTETREKNRQELLAELGSLNDLWHEEFLAVKGELDKINARHTSLAIEPRFKGDKDAMLEFAKDVFRGSRIRESTLKNLVDEFADFGAMYRDWAKVKELAGTNPEVFEDYFRKNFETLAQWQPPNRFVIRYRGKELKEHSLGQRASALMLFVLSQHENDLVIIDQPEDDLDNQTIYADVITLIREMKPQMQFIFATHNANFPVLGDAEQVHSCRYGEAGIAVESGGIDNAGIQKEIVDILEGGEEAFKKRKDIYTLWKPQS